MTAFLRASLRPISCRLSVSPGVMVLTFQHPRRSTGVFAFFVLFGAQFTARLFG